MKHILRRLLALLIFLSILYFPLGWFAVTRGWLTKDLYFAVAAVVGALASITSLFAFVRPTITTQDFQVIELETVERATKTDKRIADLEGRKNEAENELEELTRTKQEMAALVKKASMALFLKEDRERIKETIAAAIAKDSQLQESLEKYRELSDRIRRLDEEVEEHPDATLLQEIISKAKAKKKKPAAEIEEAICALPIFGPYFAVILRITRIAVESWVDLLRIVMTR